MNLDTAIFAQIQPYLLESRKMKLNDEDGKSLVADLYMGAYDFYHKELPKYRKRLEHLESLKSGKTFEVIDNLQNQQTDIVEESEDKKDEYLCKIYNKWVDEHVNVRNEM